MIKDMWDDGVRGKILSVLLVVCIVILVGLILSLLCLALDSLLLPSHTGVAIITGKSFVAEHTTTTLVMSGKVLVPITMYHPDSWYVAFSNDGLFGVVSVYQWFYNQVGIGDECQITYRIGRLSKIMYIDSVVK